MRIRSFALGLVAVLGVASAGWAQTPAADPEASALSWQKQATDTRAAVAAVAEELGKLGDQGNAAAKGMIDDAVRWLEEGDKSKTQGDERMAAADYTKASQAYNMAWQHYVRAATSGLNAKRILTGE
jgi:hypothetical protein